MNAVARSARRAVQPQAAEPDLPVALPDSVWEAQATLRTSRWLVVAGAAPGSKRTDRLTLPTPGDDRWRVRSIRVGRTDALLLAVSDGAGSASHSGLGAEVATAAALDTAERLLLQRNRPGVRRVPTRRDGVALVASVRGAVQRTAEAHGVARRSLAATLLLAVLTPRFTWIVQVGDGGVVGRWQEGPVQQLALATWPQQGEYANQTSFVGDDDARPAVVRWPAVDDLALFSDGLQHLGLSASTRSAHGPFFVPFWTAVRGHPSHTLAAQLSAWLASPVVGERTDDDVTLLLAVTTGAAAEAG